MSRRARLGVAGALAALALGLAGCGIPTSPTAEVLPKGGLPAGLEQAPGRSTTSSTSTSTTLAPSQKPTSQDQVTVFFVASDGHLFAVHRVLGAKPTPDGAVAQLINGPSAREKNLSSPIPPDVTPPDVAAISKAGIARVDLGSSFGDLFGQQLYQSLAEVAYTLIVNFPAIKGINFYLRVGGPSVLFNYTPSGEAVDTPVNLATYASLAPVARKASRSKSKS